MLFALLCALVTTRHVINATYNHNKIYCLIHYVCAFVSIDAYTETLIIRKYETECSNKDKWIRLGRETGQ